MPFPSRRAIEEQAHRRTGDDDRTSSVARRRLVLGGALVLLATVWWFAPSAPVEPVVGQAPMKMHVAEIVPTDAAFHEPTRAFHGNVAYWRISIRDAQNQPVGAARVGVDVVAPDGVVRTPPQRITGTDGFALFTYPLSDNDLPGVYTLRVVTVSHLHRGDAEYDSAANDAWATSFSLAKSARRRP
jgi:hypothetical protein